MKMINIKFTDFLVVSIVLTIAVDLALNIDMIVGYQMGRSMYYYALVFFVYMYASTKFLTSYVKDISRAEKLFVSMYVFILNFLINALFDEIGS